MNTRLLRKIQKQILKEPKQLQMHAYYQNGSDIPNCGTAACIAGWAIAIDRNKNPRQMFDYLYKKDMHIVRTACRALELEWSVNEYPDNSDRLFHVRHWPAKFSDKYNSAKTANQRAKVAVARINHFIKTKGKE